MDELWSGPWESSLYGAIVITDESEQLSSLCNGSGESYLTNWSYALELGLTNSAQVWSLFSIGGMVRKSLAIIVGNRDSFQRAEHISWKSTSAHIIQETEQKVSLKDRHSVLIFNKFWKKK